jgi:predicted site-specific integrase-resolvase
MPLTIDGQTYYRTADVCRMVGISRNTLFNWCKKGTIIKVEHRDYRGWRLFTQGQVDAMKEKTKQVNSIYLEHLVKVSSSAGHSWEPTSTAGEHQGDRD